MVMVNMFLGEPFRMGAKMLQELESNKSKNNHEYVTQYKRHTN